MKRKLAEKARRDEQDSNFGFERYISGSSRLGWLLNMHETITINPETSMEMTAIDCYFLQENGETFKATFTSYPYIYVACKDNVRVHMEGWLQKRYSYVKEIKHVEKVDLDLNNHLSGNLRTYLKVIFHNQLDLIQFSRRLRWIVGRNKAEMGMSSYTETFSAGTKQAVDLERELLDIREYDVDYTTRMCIDYDLRVGKWFEVCPQEGSSECVMRPRDDLVVPPDAKVFAYDIETCKAPLKFPDADRDQIMMISYMINTDGYLITNREVVAEDIEDFEYTPKPEYEGVFSIFNEKDEKSLIERFFEHIKDEAPNVFVTYNGDFFDWPYVRDRALFHGIIMEDEIGVVADHDIFGCRFAVHMDCFNWVQRDSYLPQGSQGLKAVTRYKLGYDPVELDPEDMEPFARERPQELATYSVSDAVATYYLFKKYVQAFVFSLCGIIPMNSGDVLRKGSGTLCEALLMVQAYKKNIICPNKQKDESLHFYKGHLLESETYIGGHVECFESGIFREDIPVKFVIEPESYQTLIDDIDETMKFFIEVEAKMKLEDITNYDEVKAKILEQLEAIRDTPRFEATPLIYHLDVAAMYPNIILTNRLQPVAVVDKATCAACDFNRPDSECQRHMDWRWRGRYYPASKGEVSQVRGIMEVNPIPKTEVPNWQPPWGQEDDPNETTVMFIDLKKEQQNTLIKKRVKEYSTKVHRKQQITVEENRISTICQRENGFYVDTVRAFRDRRYTYKGLTRKWKGTLKAAKGDMDKMEAAKMVTLYDSLQLAHKCILNSFYGYVMRKGARWYSMPMAAITTHVGGTLIKMAHILCEKIGRPLELDTDGIWTLVPGTFPEEYELYTTNPKKKKITLEYPGSMLNLMTHRKYTNHQFQELLEPHHKRQYSLSSECSIFFEVDGPYLAMILPASTEEGKMLKKRYAVYNRDHSLAELKGFEIKRRGELNVIKYFQKEIFKTFLLGTDLQSCYDVVGAVAKRFLDLIDTKAVELTDEDLFDLIMENKNMSKSMEEYGGRRSTSITCAKRLAEFLGNEMIQGGGLQCKFIISEEPRSASVSDRAIPVAIFQAEKPIKQQFLRKWTKDHSLSSKDFDIRNILDWAYYRKRVGANIQKIVTIPAAMQKIANPLPQLAHPPWLYKRLREMNDPYQQRSIKTFFTKCDKPPQERKFGATPRGETQAGSQPHVDTTLGSMPESLPLSMDVDTQLDTQDVIEGEHLGPGENPLPEGDEGEWRGWLAKQKLGWKYLNNLRKKRKQDQAEIDFAKGRAVKRSKHSEGINSYIQKRMDHLYKSEWQIVQIAPTAQPGTYNLWVFTSQNTLQQIRLSVKRVFYVNTDGDSEVLTAKGGIKVHRTLPRGRECLELIEMKMPEHTFEAQKKNIHLYMTKAHVEGVYELHVDPAFRTICDIGCVTKVHRMTRKRPEHSSTGFDLSELQYCEIPSTDNGYLSKVNHSTAFFYLSVTANGRALLGFIHEEDLGIWHASIVVVNPFKGTVEDVSFKGLCCSLAEEQDITPPEMNHKLIQVRTLTEAYSKINQLIEEFDKGGIRGNTILLSQTVMDLPELYRRIPSFQEEYPVVEIPFVWEDNDYPALQWYSFVAKRLVHRFISAPGHFRECCNFARYLHCPIGNMGKEPTMFAIDVFFARHLRDNNSIWWASKGPRPDLGGQEEDENLFEDEHQNPTFILPGMYHTICVELDLNMLHINAILKSDDITSIEVDPRKLMGDGEATDDVKRERLQSRYTFDDASTCRGAFSVLRKFTKTLVENLGEAEEGETNYANDLLNDIYRWLHSSRAYLHDPLLHRYVHKLMKKVFVQLLTKLRGLSAKIVYASFNKIIIDTGKTTMQNAESFVRYSIETLTMDDSLFEWVEFEPSKWWGYLAFLDSANHGGYELGEKEGLTQQDDPLAEENLQRTLIMDSWNIVEYLPEPIHPYFLACIGEYIRSFYDKFLVLVKQQQEAKQNGTEETHRDDLLNQFENFRKQILRDKIMPKMYMSIEEIHEKYPPNSNMGSEQTDIFPRLPGSHLPLHHPGLEFVKYVTRVLELDEVIAYEVHVFKRNALKLVASREFAKDTDFVNPCLTHVLPDMVCTSCKVARDLDVCRDKKWACTVCGWSYDAAEIESRLVEVVQRRNMAYQVQDLKCQRCGLVKACLMSEYCDCSGPWENTMNIKDFSKEVSKFVTIAKFYQFEWLEEVALWISNQATGGVVA